MTANVAALSSAHLLAHRSRRQKPSLVWLGSLLSACVTRLKPKYWLGSLFVWRLILLSRIQFPAIVGQKSPFPCWPSIGDFSQLPDAAHISYQIVPSIFQPAMAYALPVLWISDNSMTTTSLLPPPPLPSPLLLLQAAKENSAFKSLLWLGQEHLDNLS